MLSKEECEIALENAVDTGIIKKDWNVLNQLIDEHFEVLDVIKEEVDDIQTVIDLLDVLAMGHIDIAIKKLEIIQDKLHKIN
ncbi:hypothetical protein KSU57_04870 [Erysipelatoclostridium ramosum]|uniref:hypothetical protein n=1 Tax=Thomasclavelia ramosa TaxID=1547 RepID=UPI001C3896E6|nr:hypothetical protein [Thomasclavelia ramosa]MBV3157860.1 hypothetical protein [Thomasclavelia ramosa]